MEKILLNDTSFLIPVRFDTIARLENTLVVIDFLYSHFDTHITVLEAAPYSSGVFTSVVKDKVKYCFVEDHDIVFHKTKYTNMLADMTNTPYIAIWDADVIADTNQIIDAVNRLRQGKTDMAYPYDGTFMDTSEPIRTMFLRQPAIDFLHKFYIYMNLCYGKDAKGGAVFLNAEKYRQAGMDDESFYGWGNEDFERYFRYQQRGLKIYRSKGCLYHLTHPRDINGGYRSKEQYKKTINKVISTICRPDVDKKSFADMSERFAAYKILLPMSNLNKTFDIQGIITEIPTCTSDLKTDTATYRQDYGFDLSPSEIQNFATHRNAWKQFLQSDAQWCLIAESNVDIDASTDDFLDPIAGLPSDWEVFIPYTKADMHKRSQAQSHGLNKSHYLKLRSKLQNSNPREHARPEPYLLQYKFGNSIYFLNRKGAEKLLDIDCITDRLDHTMLKMKGLRLYMEQVSWFDVSQITDYEWTDRNQIILDGAIELCDWTDLRIKRARKLLETVSEIGLTHNMDLMIDAGTLLAYIRHGGMMLWDDDFDIGIEDKYLPLFFEEIDKRPNLRHDEFEFRGTRYFKVWDINGEVTENHKHTFPFIDIWPFCIRDNTHIYENRNTYYGAGSKPPVEVVFEGARFKMPHNPLEVLDSRYSDWRNTIRVYTLCHRLQNFNMKYLTIPIRTDDKGLFIGVV